VCGQVLGHSPVRQKLYKTPFSRITRDGRHYWLRVPVAEARPFHGCNVPRGKAKTVGNRVPVAVYLPKESFLSLKERADKERRSLSNQALVYIESGLREAAYRSD
jgi:hypothetical protein